MQNMKAEGSHSSVTASWRRSIKILIRLPEVRNEKYLIITIIVILILAGCGKKEEAADSGSGKNNSSSSAESSAETNNVIKNPYFLKDSIYVPVEIAFSDSDYSIQYEYNDKGWLTRSYEKDTDYEQVSDFLYEEDGNLVNVTVKKSAIRSRI